MQRESISTIPFIARFAEPRRENVPLIGKYDEEKKVTVINGTPLIKSMQTIETLTKTEASREGDDASERQFLLESSTKTAVQREGDDFAIVETMTKTFTERESDDDRAFLLELMTKTRMDREGDDNHLDI